jgi:gluconolactonase
VGATAEVVATGIRFAEGPVWCAPEPERGRGRGSIVCTSVADGALERVHLDDGRVERVASVGGGANAALLASDGGFLVTQNGGIDFTKSGLYGDDPPPYRPVTPGIQRVDPTGAVTYLDIAPGTGDAFLAPNDLVATADGALWFTDPPHHPPPPESVGRVHVLEPDGRTRVAADGLHYPNGIAFEPDGTTVIIEGTGLMRLLPDGREWVVERIGAASGDGMCVDRDGRLYVAATSEHGVRVYEPDGTEVDFLPIPGHGIVTNCCFGGDELRTLFATDGLPGQLVAWEGMPTPGLVGHPWPAA